MFFYRTISGWWLTYPSEKYELVSWDDYNDYSQYMEKCSKPPTRYIVILLFQLLTIINHRLPIDYPGKFHNHQPDLFFFQNPRTRELRRLAPGLQQLSQMSINFHPKLGDQKL